MSIALTKIAIGDKKQRASDARLVRFISVMEVIESSGLSGIFPPTRWTWVRMVKAEKSRSSTGPLNDICKLYRTPVLKYVKMVGYAHADAEDLTQDFFENILGDELFEKCERQRGRLRSLICVALNRFLIDRGRYERALKRGRSTLYPTDINDLEKRLQVAAGHSVSPDIAFARHCFREMLDRAFEQLEERYRLRGQIDLYRLMIPFVPTCAHAPQARLEAAQVLGLSQGAFNNRVQRLRKEYRRILTDRIAKTVATWDHVDEEMRYLRRVFSD